MTIAADPKGRKMRMVISGIFFSVYYAKEIDITIERKAAEPSELPSGVILVEPDIGGEWDVHIRYKPSFGGRRRLARLLWRLRKLRDSVINMKYQRGKP